MTTKCNKHNVTLYCVEPKVWRCPKCDEETPAKAKTCSRSEAMSDLIARIDEAIDYEHAMGFGNGDSASLLRDCRAEIERLSKPYVPMTDDEILIMMAEWYDDDEALPIIQFIQYVETAVIKRAGLEIKP